MTLDEMKNRCKNSDVFTEDDLWSVTPIYCLLDFNKDDFCRLIDAIGIEKWTAAANRWKRLEVAETWLTEREVYNKNKSRLRDIEEESVGLREAIQAYELNNALRKR